MSQGVSIRTYVQILTVDYICVDVCVSGRRAFLNMPDAP